MNITITGEEFLSTWLQRQANSVGFQRGLFAAGVHLRDKWSPYPPERHAQQPFKSPASRGAFFAKLRAGEIVVPYPRGSAPNSQRTSTRWGVVQVGGAVIVGNTASNAALLYSKAKQSFYHRATGWKTDEQIWREEKPNVSRILGTETRKG